MATIHVMPGGTNDDLSNEVNLFNASTRLDAAVTQPGFLDVKMRTEIVSPPVAIVAVLGAEATLSCQVRRQ